MAENKSGKAMQSGHVMTAKDGREYFICGRNQIEISEHFAGEGKSLGELIEEVILYTADHKRTA